MFRVGDFEIHRLVETTMAGSPRLFRDWDEAAVTAIPGYVPAFYDPATKTWPGAVCIWLIKGPHGPMLVDLGSGNGKQRPGWDGFHDLSTSFLEDLAALGVAPADVTHVLYTHLHVDHVGWGTVKSGDAWVPTFPNARHVMTAEERAFRDPERTPQDPARAAPFVDSVAPVIAAGLAVTVEGTETDFLPGVDFLPIPGHARGMMAIRLRSGGESALFVGDAMHQPVQVHHPDWASGFCEDRPLSIESRRRILGLAAGTGALVLPCHFGGSGAGHVRAEGEGWAWVPA